MSNQARIEFLESEISRHDELYWNNGSPEISDPDYDALVRELAAFQPEHPLVSRIRTEKVAGKGKKVAHPTPMLSLKKIYAFAELLDWCAKVARGEDEPFLVMPKLDGCSARLYGKTLATRGDGQEGEDISHHAGSISVLSPLYQGPLAEAPPLSVHGEIVIGLAVFERERAVLVRGSNGEPYKIPRSAVAGMLNNDTPNPLLNTLFSLVDFNYFADRLTLAELRQDDWAARIGRLKDGSFPYAVDGLVIALADSAYADSLGITASAPRGKVAYKLGNPYGDSTLEAVEWQPGKNSITPVGIVRPVVIDGITNTRVSLHNADFIRSMDVAVGDIVRVERAGEIIPQIKEVLARPQGRAAIVIEACPACGAAVSLDGPEVVCPQDDCPGKALQRLTDAIARAGIEGVGETTVKKLMDHAGVKDLVGVFRLTPEQIEALPGFARKSAENLFGAISTVKGKGLESWRVLATLNLPGIGTTLSKRLLKGRTLQGLAGMMLNEFAAIPDFGPERASLLVEGLKRNAAYLANLASVVPVIDEAPDSGGTTVCFTGKADRPRSEWERLARAAGFEPCDRVGKGLGLLVTSDPGSGSSKMKNAAKFGVRVISYQEFQAGLAAGAVN